ncbi:hypothetical protein ZWY2020_010379 [Hordeum vulgare]|nr:hypothetical protein ZWY2020_010379 [Hordeum vulgare]
MRPSTSASARPIPSRTSPALSSSHAPGPAARGVQGLPGQAAAAARSRRTRSLSWDRYVEWLYQHKQLGLFVDVSRMGFTDDFLRRMELLMQRAFVAMWGASRRALSPTPTRAAWLGPTGSATPASPQLLPPHQDREDHRPHPRLLPGHHLCQGEELKSTLVIVISKSGGTPETRNGLLEVQKAFRDAGLISKTGFDPSSPFLHVNSYIEMANAGVAITQENSLLDNTARIEDAALQGIDVKEMLVGAALMDEETRNTVVKENPAALLALSWYWATEGIGSKDMVVLPYKDSLLLLSRYLQQLVMESLGKNLTLMAIGICQILCLVVCFVTYKFLMQVNQGLTVYGNKGSTDQHAYIQQLREGAQLLCYFIEVLRDRPPGHDWEFQPGVTCGDYLFGMLQGTRSALYSNDRESISVTVQEVTPRAVEHWCRGREKAAGEVLALQKRVLTVLNEARYEISYFTSVL